jgi:hypothetical protein
MSKRRSQIDKGDMTLQHLTSKVLLEFIALQEGSGFCGAQDSILNSHLRTGDGGNKETLILRWGIPDYGTFYCIPSHMR